ncbi:hypothetical protein FACS1894204_06400 [Synergistales bacterium]|nr:hypothetical protein FACS1894204_06400 [Synergistales bacterium]
MTFGHACGMVLRLLLPTSVYAKIRKVYIKTYTKISRKHNRKFSPRDKFFELSLTDQTLTDQQRKMLAHFLDTGGVYMGDNTDLYFGRGNLETHLDKDGFVHVVSGGKELYFKAGMSKEEAICHFNSNAAEMDVLSPHRYVTEENYIIGTISPSPQERCPNSAHDSFCVKLGDVVADIGAQEANFSLSVIDIASHVYIFECEKCWTDALTRTFAKYKDKVTIVNKYVGDKDGGDFVTLDSFFEGKQINFIKADIEGAETSMLAGGKKLFGSRKDLKAAVCTYHRTHDAKNAERFFNNLGYNTTFTDGEMFYPCGDQSDYIKDYFRKAIIRAWK